MAFACFAVDADAAPAGCLAGRFTKRAVAVVVVAVFSVGVAGGVSLMAGDTKS